MQLFDPYVTGMTCIEVWCSDFTHPYTFILGMAHSGICFAQLTRVGPRARCYTAPVLHGIIGQYISWSNLWEVSTKEGIQKRDPRSPDHQVVVTWQLLPRVSKDKPTRKSWVNDSLFMKNIHRYIYIYIWIMPWYSI